MIPFLDPAVFGCALASGYGYSKRPSTYRMPALKGRPRYRLKDTRAVYEVNVTFDWTHDQFREWQLFWAYEINHGNASFMMNLMMDEAAFHSAPSGEEQYLVHMIAPYQASLSGFDKWDVSFTVEAPSGFRVNLFDCPDIYGGPIDALAADDIWGGPIDALATDVIIPCPGIDPNG